MPLWIIESFPIDKFNSVPPLLGSSVTLCGTCHILCRYTYREKPHCAISVIIVEPTSCYQLVLQNVSITETSFVSAEIMYCLYLLQNSLQKSTKLLSGIDVLISISKIAKVINNKVWFLQIGCPTKLCRFSRNAYPNFSSILVLLLPFCRLLLAFNEKNKCAKKLNTLQKIYSW